MDLTSLPARICLDYVLGIRKVFTPLLYNHKLFERKLAKVVREKEANHLQYQFDMFAHEFLVRQLKKDALNVKVFSEESGWINIGGTTEHIIIVDPFDGSHQALRTFRDVTTAIYIMDQAYSFEFCAIADLTTHMSYLADQTGAFTYYTQGNKDRLDPIFPSTVQQLSEAFVVLPSMKRSRRPICWTALVSKPKYVVNTDGIINLGRLAAGYIDAFVDPYVGQPVYEIIYAELAKQAGVIVSDPDGVPFDSATLIRNLESDSRFRYRIVSACSEILHQEILTVLSSKSTLQPEYIP